MPVSSGVVKVHYPLEVAEFLSLGRSDNYDPERERFSFSFSSKKCFSPFESTPHNLRFNQVRSFTGFTSFVLNLYFEA